MMVGSLQLVSVHFKNGVHQHPAAGGWYEHGHLLPGASLGKPLVAVETHTCCAAGVLAALCPNCRPDDN